jgi:uncharacterized protein
MRAIFLAVALVGWTLAGPVRADLVDVQQAIQRGDFRAAERELVRLAEAGDIAGQYELANFYLRGAGVARNPTAARRWADAAARRNHAGAQYLVGMLAETGVGGSRDAQEARRWYQLSAPSFDLARRALERMDVADMSQRGDYRGAFAKAKPLAEAGDANMQNFLAVAYRTGQGTTIDNAASLRWLEAAAAQNHPQALVLLGNMYETGDGRPVNLDVARQYYQRAAALDYEPARQALTRLAVAGIQPRLVPQVPLPNLPSGPPGADQFNFHLPPGFKVGFQERTPAQSLSKYVPDGESVTDWTQMITVTTLHGVVKDLNAVVREILAPLRARCTGSYGPSTAARSENGYPTARTIFNCDNMNTSSPPPDVQIKRFERMAIKAIQGRTGVFIVQRAWHSNTSSVPSGTNIASLQTQWAAFLDEIEICAPGQCRLPSQHGVADLGRAPTPAPPPAAGVRSAGTGFVVNRSGHVLTNNHVVAGCPTLTVRQPGDAPIAAAIVATDAAGDLAVVRLAEPKYSSAVFRQDRAVRAGDSVIAYGFPFAGQLLSSEGNLTIGSISALAGIGDDSRMMQVTVPVQPGSSGGPLLDASGNVVGMVTSKLNALAVAARTGDVPQNVNFAIKDSVIRSFLQNNGIAVDAAPSTRRREPADIGDIARKFTVQVECRR